jgi:hypothetical protein
LKANIKIKINYNQLPGTSLLIAGESHDTLATGRK